MYFPVPLADSCLRQTYNYLSMRVESFGFLQSSQHRLLPRISTEYPQNVSMAPRLSFAQRARIHALILRKLPNSEIADTVRCTERAVRRIRSRLGRFGTTTAPSNRVGPDPKITPFIRHALCEQLSEKPGMLRREMVAFIYDRFGVEVSESTITRTLKAQSWSRKTIRRVANQRNPALRDFYHYRLKLEKCRSYQLIFIDESGIDKRDGLRRKGWAPKGKTPEQKSRFQRGQRLQILAAYTQRGVKLARVFPGSTDAAVFEDFIDQLLHHCSRWPEPESVLVMDNATIHYSDRIEQLCKDAGVKLMYLAPYSPDTNPIEEFFAEVKEYVKSRWDEHVGLISRDVRAYVMSCVEAVGNRQASAEGHFRKAGLAVEEHPEETE
jgi:transposase